MPPMGLQAQKPVVDIAVADDWTGPLSSSQGTLCTNEVRIRGAEAHAMVKVHVDPELLQQAAQKTQHVSDRINQTLNTLQSSSDSKGSPWGDDVYGYK